LTDPNGILKFPGGSSAYSICYVPLIVYSLNNAMSITVTIPTAPIDARITQPFLNKTGVVLDSFGDSIPTMTFTFSPSILRPLLVGSNVAITDTALSNLNNLSNMIVASSTTDFVTIVGYCYTNAAQPYYFDAGNLKGPIYSAAAVANAYGGSGYSVGDSFVFSGTMFGGTNPINNLTVTVTGVEKGAYSTLSLSGTAPNVSTTTTVLLEQSGNKVGYRDASDITRALKERIIYNEKRTGSPINSGKGGSLVPGRPGVNPGAKNNIPAGNAEVLWIPQGNQYRLSYLFGKLKCGDGSAGAFNLNGPLSSS